MASLTSSNASKQHVLGLLDLSQELLVQIFKVQSSFQDVSRMSQTCRLLHSISHYNSRAIADAIDHLTPIFSKEAEDLANLQLHCDSSRSNDESVLQHVHNISSAARAIATATPPLVSYCYTEALRLAGAQLAFASPNPVSYTPGTFIISDSCLLESRVAEAGLGSHFTGAFDYFGLRQRVFINTHVATRILVMAAAHFIPLARPLDFVCSVHPPNALLPHEMTRFLRAWYWFKLYILSYHLPRDGLRQALAAELACMRRVQLAIFLCVIDFLFNNLDVVQAEILGIKLLDKYTTDETYYPIESWEAREDWDDLRDNFITACVEREVRASSGWQLMLRGICDSCDGKGNCKSRIKEKGIWET